MTLFMSLVVVPSACWPPCTCASMPKGARSSAPCASRSTTWPACRASCSACSAWDSSATWSAAPSTAAFYRGQPAQSDVRHGRAHLGLVHAGPADAAGRDCRDRGSALRRAQLHARRLVRLRREQVADDPPHRAAAGLAGHHDRHDPGDGPRRRRGGPADAGRRGEARAGAARRLAAAVRHQPQLHAPGLSHLRSRVSEPEQRGRQADGLHDDAAVDRDHRRAERRRHLAARRGCGSDLCRPSFN